jgi:hypothetical protein
MSCSKPIWSIAQKSNEYFPATTSLMPKNKVI